MEPGAVMMLTLDLAPGHYAVVCNLPGHYAMGMHQDFFVTPTGSTPVRSGCPRPTPPTWRSICPNPLPPRARSRSS